MNTGKFLTIPADEYHAASRSGRHMSSHLLADFRESPELYRRKTSGKIAEAEGSALALGRAAHCLILEGRAAFDGQFLVADGPVNPKTSEPYGKATKAYADWLASQTKEIVIQKDFGFILKLPKSMKLERLPNGNFLERIPISIKYDGHKTTVTEPEDGNRPLDPETMNPLQKAMVQGIQYSRLMEGGQAATLTELVAQLGGERTFIYHSLELVNLAPDIQKAIIGGGGFLTASRWRSCARGFPTPGQSSARKSDSRSPRGETLANASS